MELKGTKIVEVPYFLDQLVDKDKSILIIGECKGGTEGISESIFEKGFQTVTTTDILPSESDSWLRKHTKWNHIQSDLKYTMFLNISITMGDLK